MTSKEAKSCIKTIEMLRRLAYNIHGVMDVIDAENCEKIIKALEQEPAMALLETTYADFCNCEGGEGWLEIDGKEYFTDVGYALEGMRIFMEVFKRRMAESEVRNADSN